MHKAVVVVADDDRAARERISKLLRDRGLAVVAANSGQKAIDAVRAQRVELVVLELNMPGLSGIDACKVVKSIAKDCFVPVVLLTPMSEASARILRSGADDHVSKAIGDEELVERLERMIRVKQTHDDVQLARRDRGDGSARKAVDALPDHLHFHDRLESEFDKAQRHLDPLACCIVAVDGFRDIVSELGAKLATGVLEEVSLRLRHTVRATDIAARFRMSEFGLLLPDTRPARALSVVDRIVSELALRPFVLGATKIELTISIGVGLYPSGAIRTHSELLDAASIAVARARVAGKNRVCVVQQQGYMFRPTVPGAA
ncbi:MAG: diguanylate cyclase [Deltaproteobacteria bacterium]|nr:diguanylate cyclase [Deltaproteobacteria bacterium]NND29570.1 diguanylate cyclase [Myxococcales bacterium]MBT8464206.1 diguanylate cyclase [Deltaproteobacteria bacterium]MBT8481724.1 diguanylate cyclase [Deltaproteobacteria bacterium]NNK06050.1 diguanylate cyclase [Myxococcales bacterium]